MNQRLTWVASEPKPYESAWSVFSKLMALNFIRPVDLYGLISRNPEKPFYQLDIHSGSWVDFGKFSMLLDVDSLRLRQCFIDELRMGRSYRDANRVIRQCPRCLENGYHSVFFHMDFLEKCPIHDIPLNIRCKKCYRSITISGLKFDKTPTELYYDKRSRLSNPCGHVTFNIGPGFKLSGRDGSNLDFNNIHKLANSLENTVRKIPGWGTLRCLSEDSFRRSVTLGLIASDDQEKLSTWLSPRIYSRFIRVFGPEILIDYHDNPDLFHSIFKSVSRHIRKTIIGGRHNRCIRILNHQDRLDRLSISPARMCTLALAYNTWLAVIYRDLRCQRIDCFRTKDNASNVSEKAYALAIYAKFHVIHASIVRNIKNSSSFILMNYSEHWHKALNELIVITGDDYLLMMPDLQNITCHHLNDPEDLINMRAWNSLNIWGWSRYADFLNDEQCLYRVIR